MIVRILGSAAGGGLPQWNCNCANCAAARAGGDGVRPRFETALAVSGAGERWVLIGAPAGLPQQIASTAGLHPGAGAPPRSSPVAAVVLAGAEVDQIAGLLGLREGQPFTVYATDPVLAALAANPIFAVLDRRLVRRRRVSPGEPFAVEGIAGLDLVLIAMPGKPPLWREADAARARRGEPGETAAVGVADRVSGRRLCFVPSCAAIDRRLLAWLDGAAVVLFDGTLFSDAELAVGGFAARTGADMGHLAMAGAHGSLAALARLAAERRIYIHLNNTNPVLRPGSPERHLVEAAGWEIAEDGMEIVL